MGWDFNKKIRAHDKKDSPGSQLQKRSWGGSLC